MHKKHVLIKIVILGLVYFLTARAGLELNAVSGFATFVWPPTGIALAALLIFDCSLWPGVFLGAFFANVATGAPALTSVAIGAGNTLEAVVGVFLLRKAGFNLAFEHLRDILLFIVCGAFLGTLVSATLGTSALLVSGIVHFSTFGSTWIAWWIGDILGALIAGSLILCLKNLYLSRQTIFQNKKKILEVFALALALVLFNWFIFFNNASLSQGNSSLVYLIFPLLIWAALRFEVIGATLAVFLTSVIAVWGTVLGGGPFVADTVSHSLLSLQIFMGSVTITILVLSAITSEKDSAYRALEKADKAKSEFVSIASHQLRTPLATVKWYVRSLLSGKVGALESKQEEYLEELDRANERMIKLVGTFLNVSKIELGVFRIKPMSSVIVRKILDEVVSEFRAQVEKKKMTIETVYPSEIFFVNADPALVRVIFQNLLSNAVKYSYKNVHIRVVLRRGEKEWTLEVADNGCGIPTEDQDKIFTKMFRAENAKKIDPSGSGLGLYMAKSVTEQAGGKIWFESEPRKGSTFHVSFPIGQ